MWDPTTISEAIRTAAYGAHLTHHARRRSASLDEAPDARSGGEGRVGCPTPLPVTMVVAMVVAIRGLPASAWQSTRHDWPADRRPRDRRGGADDPHAVPR